MTSKSAARSNDGDEVNPKIDPAPNSNTEKGPDDWVSGGDPRTGAQASYLKTSQRNPTRQRVSKRISPRLRPQNGSMP
jgi:hypothetical protein